MCVARFEEMPKKFNVGNAARLIDMLRKQSVRPVTKKEPDRPEKAQRN